MLFFMKYITKMGMVGIRLFTSKRRTIHKNIWKTNKRCVFLIFYAVWNRGRFHDWHWENNFDSPRQPTNYHSHYYHSIVSRAMRTWTKKKKRKQYSTKWGNQRIILQLNIALQYRTVHIYKICMVSEGKGVLLLLNDK